MPAPPSGSQRAANQRSMDAAKAKESAAKSMSSQMRSQPSGRTPSDSQVDRGNATKSAPRSGVRSPSDSQLSDPHNSQPGKTSSGLQRKAASRLGESMRSVGQSSMPGNSNPDLNYGRGTPGNPVAALNNRNPTLGNAMRDVQYGPGTETSAAVAQDPSIRGRSQEAMKSYGAEGVPGGYGMVGYEGGPADAPASVVAGPPRSNDVLGDLVGTLGSLFNLHGEPEPPALKPFQGRARPFAGVEDTVDPVYSPPRHTMAKSILDRVPQENEDIYSGLRPASDAQIEGSIFRTTRNEVPIPRQNPLSDTAKFNYRPGRDRDYVFGGDSNLDGVGAADQPAVSRLVAMQERYGSPFTVTSGFRGPLLNAEVEGKEKSQHLQGKAFDVHTDDPNRANYARLAQAADQAGFPGLGAYRPGLLHVDTGPERMWGPAKKQVQTALRQPSIMTANADAPPEKNLVDNVVKPGAAKVVNTFNSLFSPPSGVPIPRQKPTNGIFGRSVKPDRRASEGGGTQPFWQRLYQNSRGAGVG